MKKFHISVIVKTMETYEVEAEDEEQAEELWAEGKLIATDDDIDNEILNVEEV